MENQFDNTLAMAEGWSPFNDGEIQRLDESDVFESDFAAIAHVRAKAAAGSEYHQEALRIHKLATANIDSDVQVLLGRKDGAWHEIDRTGGDDAADFLRGQAANASIKGYTATMIVAVAQIVEWAGPTEPVEV